ncbi:uncharacterized protein LOC109838291 [Asparagus officinalis]|uniref:uncharacterized protein LOC109838291 n=1 Tax=Asparagus officinalis TaxID=4686 RepID=UPI00098E43F8|nr:uncharacterized protein LOC109838291 [Asparagus officinalis]
MINLCSIGIGATAKLPFEVLSCKLWMMRGNSRAKKKETKEAAALGFGGSRKDQEKWQCARGCGACCKLDKGPAFPTPEEIFEDDPVHLQLYKSLIGPDGWCIHYEHATRTCSIYSDRPSFCRVKPDVFKKFIMPFLSRQI